MMNVAGATVKQKILKQLAGSACITGFQKAYTLPEPSHLKYFCASYRLPITVSVK